MGCTFWLRLLASTKPHSLQKYRCKFSIYMAGTVLLKHCSSGKIAAPCNEGQRVPGCLAAAPPAAKLSVYSSSSSGMRKPMGRRFTPVPMHWAQHQRPLARQAGHLRRRRQQQGGTAGAGAHVLSAAAASGVCLSASQPRSRHATGQLHDPGHDSPLWPHAVWQHCGTLVIQPPLASAFKGAKAGGDQVPAVLHREISACQL